MFQAVRYGGRCAVRERRLNAADDCTASVVLRSQEAADEIEILSKAAAARAAPELSRGHQERRRKTTMTKVIMIPAIRRAKASSRSRCLSANNCAALSRMSVGERRLMFRSSVFITRRQKYVAATHGTSGTTKSAFL